MRRAVLAAVSAALLTAVLATTGGHSAQLAASQNLNLFPAKDDRVYPTVITGKVGEVRAYRGDIGPNSTDQGKYRANCVWLGAAGDNRLDCTIVLRLGLGMVVVHGLIDPPGNPRLLSQTSSAGLLAITGGTGAYNGARGYVQLSPQFVTVVIA
jgi:hypothetical protein